MTELGNRVRRLRLKMGATQEAISSQKVSVPYISRIETGDIAFPSADALMAIASKLNTTALFLETGEHGRCPYCGRE